MENFLYFTPTKVYFGKNAEQSLGQAIKDEKASKVLVVYGGQSAKKSGLLDRVYAYLGQAGLEYVSLGGVMPNPRLSKVYEGIELSRAEKVDFILAVGGGSVIDTCKAIGSGLCYDGDVWDLYTGKAICGGCTPLGCILTIAATGSEMSNGSVITKDENLLKRSFDSDYCRCKFAIMSPELTYSLPPYQTSSGSVDIIMHTLERYFSVSDFALTDALSASIVKNVITYSKKALEKADDYEARANLMWAGSLSHNGLTGCGTIGDFASHMIEHELGGMFDVAHGAGLAAIWGSWARYVIDVKPERFAQFAAEMMDIPAGDLSPKEHGLLGIEALENYFRDVNMPTTLHELGIDPTDAQIDELADKCCDGDTHPVGNFKKLWKEDVKNILLAAR
ncbi:MAG: iron-containing alcohol dehydrogenase [Oscillospiraceae bacterium]|nr:iron-containing alcohol dehydrogenase [Oscillospiraceae bacterium]